MIDKNILSFAFRLGVSHITKIVGFLYSKMLRKSELTQIYYCTGGGGGNLWSWELNMQILTLNQIFFQDVVLWTSY